MESKEKSTISRWPKRIGKWAVLTISMITILGMVHGIRASNTNAEWSKGRSTAELNLTLLGEDGNPIPQICCHVGKCPDLSPEPDPEPDPNPEPICPNGAECFHFANFTPTTEKPVARHRVDLPAAEYDRVILDMDVTLSDDELLYGRYNFFWLTINKKNKNMLGYAMALVGPKDQFKFRHGMQLTQEEKITASAQYNWEPGDSAAVMLDYDVAKAVIAVTLSDKSGDITIIESVPNIRLLALTKPLYLDIGFSGKQEDEHSSIGWKYEDIKVIAYPSK